MYLIVSKFNEEHLNGKIGECEQDSVICDLVQAHAVDIIHVQREGLDGVVEPLAAVEAGGGQEGAAKVLAGLGEAGQPCVHF